MRNSVVPDDVLIGMVGNIPMVVSRTIADFRCCIPVVPGGDKATDAPLAERTARCEHRTRYLIGSAPTCEHHIRAAVGIAQGDEWYAPRLAVLPWKLDPCE